MKELLNLISLTHGHDLMMSSKVDLIASNSCMSDLTRLAMSSLLSNNYCIGFPGARLYGGCTYIDMIEREVHSLIRQLFGNTRYVVVQFLSGMQANIAAYHATLKKGDRVIAAQTKHGGHYSHTLNGPLQFFSPEMIPMPFDEKKYNIDLNKLEEVVKQTHPKLMILGWSEFLFPHPLEEIRLICDRYQIKMMYDMSHVVGLIAGGVFQPEVVRYADMMTSSTGKSLHAPDHGLVLYNDPEFDTSVRQAVMPLLTSNTHPHELAGLGIALTEMLNFGSHYAKQVVKNTKALAYALVDKGINVLYGDLDYSDSHTLLVEFKQSNEAVVLLDRAGILINACPLPWDSEGANTGLRIGTQAITRRGFTEKDMPFIAEIISDVLLKNKVPEIMQFSHTTHLSNRMTKTFFSFDEYFELEKNWYGKILKSIKVSDLSTVLRSSPAFANCSLNEIDSFIDAFEMIKLKKDKVIFEKGSPSDSVYFVAQGKVAIVEKMDKKEKVIDLIGENRHFGELGVMSKNNRMYSAICHEHSVLLKIKAANFMKILVRFESVKKYFDRYIISLEDKRKNV